MSFVEILECGQREAAAHFQLEPELSLSIHEPSWSSLLSCQMVMRDAPLLYAHRCESKERHQCNSGGGLRYLDHPSPQLTCASWACLSPIVLHVPLYLLIGCCWARANLGLGRSHRTQLTMGSSGSMMSFDVPRSVFKSLPGPIACREILFK